MAHARGSELERADAFGVVRQLFEPRLRAMSSAARSRALGGAAALAAPVVLPEAAPPSGAAGTFEHEALWRLVDALDPDAILIHPSSWADLEDIEPER